MQFFFALLAALSLACPLSAGEPARPLPLPAAAADKLPQHGGPKRIIAGKPVAAGEVKHQVALLRAGAFWCGGSIIRPNVVLTAAHCVFGNENTPSLFSIRYGTINQESGLGGKPNVYASVPNLLAWINKVSA